MPPIITTTTTTIVIVINALLAKPDKCSSLTRPDSQPTGQPDGYE